MYLWTDENLATLNEMFKRAVKGPEHIKEKLSNMPSFNLFSTQEWENINNIAMEITQ